MKTCDKPQALSEYNLFLCRGRGFRLGDYSTLTAYHFKDGMLPVRQQKTKPRLPERVSSYRLSGPDGDLTIFYIYPSLYTSVAEVDYLFLYKEKLIPVEVKSGATGTLRSMLLFMDMAPHNIAVRFYAGEILISTITTGGGKTVHLLNLPYYLVSQIEKYIEWFELQIEK